MDFGVHLPHLGRQADGSTLRRFAREAERLGFHSLWTSDHIAWPAHIRSKYPYSATGSFPAPFDVPWLDPLGALLHVAACTERVKLGTSVLILGYRPVIQTAKQWATLDIVSGGRAIAGVGVGWMREEFEALGMPFDHRGARADEQLEAWEALWSSAFPSYTGRYVRFPEVGFQPRPVNGRIPIWVGGDTEAAFRRAARFGDAFHAAFQPLDEVVAGWSRVRSLAADSGRDPEQLRLSLRVHLDFGAVAEPAKAVQGSPDQMLGTLATLRAAGVTHVLLDILAPGGSEGRLRAMQRFAAEVAPRVEG